MAAPQSPTLAQFDVARKRAAQSEQANLQTQKSALERRAAQLGGGPSGALIKQERIAADESAQRLQGANEGINAQEMQERGRIQEIKEGRAFARSERLGSQGFAAQQAGLQRKFQTGERLGGESFASREARLGRDFAQSERKAGQSFASWQAHLGRNQQAQMAALENQRFYDQLGFNKEQFAEQFAHQKMVDEFNMKLAKRIQRSNEQGFFEGLFGGGGNGGFNPFSKG